MSGTHRHIIDAEGYCRQWGCRGYGCLAALGGSLGDGRVDNAVSNMDAEAGFLVTGLAPY